MAVVIRLKRTGRRNRPCFRISVADSRWRKEGRTLDNLGLYDPISPKADEQSKVDVELARKWLGNGAVPSQTVRSLFKRHGVYEGDFVLGVGEGSKARKGRRKVTKTRERRVAAEAARAERKSARRSERTAAKRAAKKGEPQAAG